MVDIRNLPGAARKYGLDVQCELLDIVDILGQFGPEFDTVIGTLGLMNEHELVRMPVLGSGDQIAFVFDPGQARIVFLDIGPASGLSISRMTQPAEGVLGRHNLRFNPR